MAPKSFTRRRSWERQVKLWESTVQGLLDAEREIQGLEPDERIPDAILVGEVMEMARPMDAYPPMDAVIPAPRSDLAQTWIRERLAGRLDSEDKRRKFARKIAPIPGDGHGPLRLPVGLDDGAVLKGVEQRHRDTLGNSR
jgi:hypothetical protein